MSTAVSIPVIPESAPFSPAQRAWLNGFLAGLISRQPAATRPEPAPPAAEETFPWHDASLPLDERMKLADGKPFDRVLMAAMAQLDCGACGYLCKTYSEAIANGVEKDLTRCAPGGKETARKLKELVSRRGDFAKPAVQVKVNGTPIAAPTTPDRNHPCAVPLQECRPLNSPKSAKDTRFVSIDLTGSGLAYDVGDALGVYPENCPDTVQWILDALDASGDENVALPDGKGCSLHEALFKHYTITKPSDALIELLMTSASDAGDRASLKAMMDGDGAPPGLEVLDLLRQYRSARPGPEQFVGSLLPLQPRLYSISSSLKSTPNQVHLTVGVVRFLNPAGRQCKGVASTYLSERIKPGQKLRVFVQKSHGFALPRDGSTPIIMVGPGTGIAPFRAFLHERRATSAPGKNWLFFGDQRREHDFLYRDEIESMLQSGLLTRLDTAFSRDQAEKIYVQHRMLENSVELWRWLEDGAHFYVCGDAKRMAGDVDAALRTVVQQQGGMTPDQARQYLANLTKTGRYQRDVY